MKYLFPIFFLLMLAGNAPMSYAAFPVKPSHSAPATPAANILQQLNLATAQLSPTDTTAQLTDLERMKRGEAARAADSGVMFGIMGLGCVLLALFVAGIMLVPAFIFGILAIKKGKDAREISGQYNMGTGGRALGIITIVLSVILLMVVLAALSQMN